MAAKPSPDFALAHAGGASWARLAKSCADQLVAGGNTGNLGFLYATDVLAGDLAGILTYLRERTSIEAWVGTVGIGVCATGREYFDEPAIAVMTARLPEDAFRLLPPLADGDAAARPLVTENGGGAGAAPTVAIVHGDPRNPHIEDIIDNLARRHSCFLVGGLSASRQGFPQISGQVADGGLSGVLLSAAVPVAVGLTQGCNPVGPARTVSGADLGTVSAIDGRRALDVLCEDVGCAPGPDLAAALADIHVAFPVTGSDTGDYLVRNLTAVAPEEGTLAMDHDVVPGERLMFCRRDRDSALVDLERMIADVRRRADAVPRAGLYFSCVGRGANLFGPESEELRAVAQGLGDFPLVGFFGNGEISRDRLYGYTGVLVLFL